MNNANDPPNKNCQHIWRQFVRHTPGDRAAIVCKYCKEALGLEPHPLENILKRCKMRLRSLELTNDELQKLHDLYFKESLSWDEMEWVRLTLNKYGGLK